MLSSLVRAPGVSSRAAGAAIHRRVGMAGLGFAALRASAFAQDTTAAEDAAACAACGACSGAMLIIPIAFFAINVALLVWVARDAKARGMDSAVLWMVLVMFTSVLGLVIYVLSRPQGDLVQCPHCNNKRLQASAKCPHCGNP